MTTNLTMNDDYVRVVGLVEWFNTMSTTGVWYAVSPLLGGVELKYQSPNWRLCSRLAHDEHARCSVAGVSPILAAEYWAWQEQWGVFARYVAANPNTQDHILCLAPVQLGSVSLERLEQAPTIVRSVAAAQACIRVLEEIQ